VFGLPVVRLGELEPAVTCDGCGRTSDRSVLDVPTTAQLASILRDATLAAFVRAARAAAAEDLDVIVDAAMKALADDGYTADIAEFETELSDLSDADADARLRRVGRELTAYGKQGFLHRVTAVTSATEPITREQRDTLTRIGCRLGMAPPHINGILAVAAAAA